MTPEEFMKKWLVGASDQRQERVMTADLQKVIAASKEPELHFTPQYKAYEYGPQADGYYIESTDGKFMCDCLKEEAANIIEKALNYYAGYANDGLMHFRACILYQNKICYTPQQCENGCTNNPRLNIKQQ